MMAAPIVGENLLGLALVPHSNQVFGVLKDLAIGRPPAAASFHGFLPAGIVHIALVESHGRIVANRVAAVNPRRKRGFSEETVNERRELRWPRR